jgi:hypothetical protein
MVHVMLFKRSKERIHRNVCWFLTHSCLAKSSGRFKNHTVVAMATTKVIVRATAPVFLRLSSQ